MDKVQYLPLPFLHRFLGSFEEKEEEKTDEREDIYYKRTSGKRYCFSVWRLGSGIADAAVMYACVLVYRWHPASGTFTAIAEGILAAEGFYKGAIDAEFGSLLEQAVKNVQKENGLDRDGIQMVRYQYDSWGRPLDDVTGVGIANDVVIAQATVILWDYALAFAY